MFLAIALVPEAWAMGTQDSGDTPLMLAVMKRDEKAIGNLIAAHADVQQKNAAGATALHFAIDDLPAVQMLLAADANANAEDEDRVTPLFLAADRADGFPVVEALLAHGADAKRVGVEVGAGDARSVAALLEHGASARTRDGLHTAASRGLADNLRLLLDHGADIDGRDQLGFTPLMWAAQMGHLDAVVLLLNRGADPDLQETFNGTTALMQAAACDRPSEAIVQALLAHGAEVKALDDEGANALTWALRSGQKKIAEMLIAQGSPPAPTVVFTAKGERASPTNTLEAAVARAIPPLESVRKSFRKVGHCGSCHSDALPALAIEAASTHGFAVDEKARAREAFLTVASLAPARNAYRLSYGLADIAEAGYLLVGVSAADYPPDATTDAIVRYIFIDQLPDGRWRATLQRVPTDGSEIAITAMSVRALSVYARNENLDRARESIVRARGFLSRAHPITLEDLAFQIFGLHWSGAGATELSKAMGKLASLQHDDGGFAQREGMPSDAYATSLAIVALRDIGQLANSQPAIARALHFLLENQLADGSWFVATRALRFQPFFESGFPQGRSQYMSQLATSWAVIALAGASANKPAGGKSLP